MKVKCIKKSFADDKEAARIYATSLGARLHISLGKEYIVYGITNYMGLIEYLIQEDTYRPRLYPANLFEIVDTQLPYEEWHCGKYQYSSAVDGFVQFFYVFGSKEMATDEGLFMSIILQDNEGLFHFEEWRKLVDRQYK